jgi:hypothetical protein
MADPRTAARLSPLYARFEGNLSRIGVLPVPCVGRESSIGIPGHGSFVDQSDRGVRGDQHCAGRHLGHLLASDHRADTFWTPAHLAIYLGGLLGGLTAGWLILWTTFRGAPVEKERSVRLWGFRGPLGAWVCVWGSLAMLTSAPFDKLVA